MVAATQTEENSGPEEDEGDTSPEDEGEVPSDILFAKFCDDPGVPKSTLDLVTEGKLSDIKKLFGMRDFKAVDCIHFPSNILLPVPNPKFSGMKLSGDLQRKTDKAQLASQMLDKKEVTKPTAVLAQDSLTRRVQQY